jgi:hypothetical protein
LPSDFPLPSTVRYYFDQWCKVSDETGTSLLEQALKKYGDARTRQLRQEALDELCIVDGQSVKSIDTAMHIGYDAGKMISGIRHHMAVDLQRLRHATEVMAGDIKGRKAAC